MIPDYMSLLTMQPTLWRYYRRSSSEPSTSVDSTNAFADDEGGADVEIELGLPVYRGRRLRMHMIAAALCFIAFIIVIFILIVFVDHENEFESIFSHNSIMQLRKHAA